MKMNCRIFWRNCRGLNLALCVLCLGVVAPAGSGCRRSDPALREEPGAIASEPAPVVTIQGLNVGQVSKADQAWEEVEKAMQAPPAPADWQTREPSSSELVAFERELGAAAADGAGKARAFYESFPDHDKASAARAQELEMLGVAAELGQTNILDRLAQLESAHLADPNRSVTDRLAIRIKRIQRSLKLTDDAVSSNTVAVMELGVRELLKDFPDRLEPRLLLLSSAEGWMTAGEVDRAQELVLELAKPGSPEELQAGVKQLQARLDRLGKPLVLKVTTLDGKELQVEALRGKVVLLHFWASWSANSVNELAKISPVYESLRLRGFEIIGISLDQERAELEQAIADHKIPWPQAFGPQAEELAEQLQIQTVPSLWLIDRKGALRDVNARGNLAGRVTRLLDER